MKLPSLSQFVVKEETRRVFVVHLPDAKLKRGYSKHSCASIWTLAKTIAGNLVDAQAKKNRRCVCGRRDLFCRYYKGAEHAAYGVESRQERDLACHQKKLRRVEKIGRWVKRKLKQQGK